MTSSLVGSEMCIRDRSSKISKQGCLRVSRCVLAKLQGRPHPSDSQEPVSYTHLTLPTICSV
eukprot:11192751-Prorocentrum_lima.AAC.1